jgi:hypothetical protein
MLDVGLVRKAINRALKDLQQKPGVRMYLVTKTGDDDNPYKLYKLEPTGEVPNHLRNALANELTQVSNIEEDKKFKAFLDPHRNPSDILFAKTESVPDFKIILDQIDQHPSLQPPPNINKMGKMWGYAVEVDNAGGSVIYFRKFTNSKLIGRADGKGKWLGKLSTEGRLTDLDGNILTFDQNVDCVYFKSLDSVMVTPPHYVFEGMFDFRDYYETETVKVMERLVEKAILQIADSGIVSKAIEKRRLIRKVAELAADGFFDRLVAGQITTYFFEATKAQIGAKLTYVIKEDKISIPDVDALSAFVDVCDEKYVKSMAGYKKGMDPRIFMTEYKEPLA